MTDRARRVMRLSAAFSRHFAHQSIEPRDVLAALAHKGGISDHVLADAGYAKKQKPRPIADADRILDAAEGLQPILGEAYEQARSLGHNYIGTEHLLLSLAKLHPELFPDANGIRRSVLDVLGVVQESENPDDHS